MDGHLTMNDLFAIFDKPIENVRWVGSADSNEYLTVVTYLVMRQQKEAA